MAIKFNQMCNGAITNTTQPHGEALIPVDTNEPTSYVQRWDVSRTANDSVRAYLLGTSGNYELHFYGTGATANYKLQTNHTSSSPWGSATYTMEIKAVVVHDGVTDLGQLTLTRVDTQVPTFTLKLSDSVRVLQRYCFQNTYIANFDLGSGLSHIHEGSLFPSTTSTAISFPPSLRIADYRVVGFYGDTDAWLNTNTTAGGYLIVGDGVLLWGKPTDTVWTIPEGVKSVCCFFWDNTANVTSVTLPSTTKYLAFAAFASYSSITSMKLPQGTERIYGLAFQNCTNLTKIWLPRSVKIIDTSTIVTNTGEYSYTSYPFTGCSNLTIYCEIDSSEMPDGWSEYWNHIASGTQATVVWNTSETAFENL